MNQVTDNNVPMVQPALVSTTETVAIDVAVQAQKTVPEVAPLSDYDARQESRRERYADLAIQASNLSQAAQNRASAMSDRIPFGQPILIGHHSETRDRSFRQRIHSTFDKAFALQEKAEHYAQKAASVGTGGVSSDDPAALIKLRAELASFERTHEIMKAANKAIRVHKTQEAQTAALVTLGYTADLAAQLLQKDFAGRIGFPSYRLSNNNANVARIKARIAELQNRRERADVEKVCAGFTYIEDTAENRVMFVFEGKPDEATRAILKAHAFKWSPSRGAWVRQLTNSGVWSGQEVLKLLNPT